MDIRDLTRRKHESVTYNSIYVSMIPQIFDKRNQTRADHCAPCDRCGWPDHTGWGLNSRAPDGEYHHRNVVRALLPGERIEGGLLLSAHSSSGLNGEEAVSSAPGSRLWPFPPRLPGAPSSTSSTTPTSSTPAPAPFVVRAGRLVGGGLQREQ